METLTNLEANLLTAEPQSLKLIHSQVIKYYQGVAKFYSGEPEDAMLLFDRVMEMSKGQLKE